MAYTYKNTCETCGLEFVRTLKRQNGFHARFCSKKCIKPRVKKTCENCKQEYEVISYRSEKTRWCSNKCRWQMMQSAPKHVYTTTEWEQARQKALERDEYTCQNCGTTGAEEALHVNHIVPYRLLQSHILPNLVTLCRSCHASMDWKVRDLLNMHPVKKRFLELLMEMWETNLRKSNDYATNNDPLSNFKRAEKIGITPFQGILVRIGDKMSRIEELSRKEGLVKSESIADTLIDLAVYSLLARTVYEDMEKRRVDKTK